MDLMERRKAFGRWLRNCRKQAHITQAELAKALDYDSSQLISNIERGVSLLPSKRLPDFARALGCSLLEMEVRYFQCSARNTSESRMPDLLLKYLPLIELMEYGRGTNEEIITALEAIRAGKTQMLGSDAQFDADDEAHEDADEGGGSATGESESSVLAQPHETL